jgi:hypothetical protein
MTLSKLNIALPVAPGTAARGQNPEAADLEHELLMSAKRGCIAAAAAQPWMLSAHPLL